MEQEFQEVHELCFKKRTIEQAFVQHGVKGGDELKKLPKIGEHVWTQCKEVHDVSTINEFLAKVRDIPNPTKTKIETFLEKCTHNKQSNSCITDPDIHTKKYHVADINVCGYNALVLLLKFVHEHQDEYETYEFDAPTPVPFQLSLRLRGTNPGARHCSCHNQGRCNQEAECRWDSNTCIPRGGGNKRAGYGGFRRPNNQMLTQRIPAMARQNGQRSGRKVVKGWMQPDRIIGRRGRRNRQPNQRLDPNVYELNGGHRVLGVLGGGDFKRVRHSIEMYETMTEKKSSALREFYNFLSLI